MHIAVLGPLEVTDDADRPIEIGGARLRTLLIMLALEAGRVVTGDRIADGLWGDAPPSGAPNALQSLISRLRRALPGAAIESHPSGYRLDVPAEAVDIARFERLVAEGRAALGADPARAVGLLARALDLWRGPALADVADAPFAREHVFRLTEQRLGAIEDHVEARLALGRADPAEVEALVAAHPLRERLRGQYMRVLCAAGRRADALATYDDVRRLLADELGVDPSPELQAVHLAVLRGEAGGAARARRAGNLRARLTSFIGREEEIERVGKLLEENRLVTLTGPGGAGKTRLAVEAAERLTDRMPGGVWLVELAPVGDPAEVPHALLSTLGLRDTALMAAVRGSPPATADPLDRLVAALAGERPLIVLDNCEHLVDACAAVVDRVLAECPGVRVLATSREPLGITGETLCQVPPLAVPPYETAAGADDDGPLGYPAVRLLDERGAAVRPGFSVSADPDAALAICRSLDGMPLAIELAAARLRTMTAAQIADRLDDRFRLLTGGSRTALPRHQTLRAVVDWSWELLDERERALLRRLSMFAGGATLEAIEEIWGADVLDPLAGLVDKSLVAVDAAGRYRLLETIRAYGAERLSEAGETKATRRAHARYFLRLAEAAEPMLRTRDQMAWLERLTAEYDNLHSALRWTIEVEDAALAIRYVAALGWHWFLRGVRIEGRQLTRDALRLPGTPPHGQACALARLYLLLADIGEGGEDGLRPDDNAAVAERIAAILDACAGVDEEDRHPMLRIVPMGVALMEGRIDDALASIERLAAARDPWLRACAQSMRGHALIIMGRVDGTEEIFGAALAEFRALGERWGLSFTLTCLAEMALWRGDPAGTKAYIDEALACSAELGSHDDAGHLRMRLAHAYTALGDEERARAELEEAWRMAESRGVAQDLAFARYAEAEVARHAGDLVRARALLEEATEWNASQPPHFPSMVNTQLGVIYAIEGDAAAALERHHEAFRLARLTHDAPIAALAVVGLAHLAWRTGDHEQAATPLGAAVGIRGTEDRSLADPPRIERAARDALGDERYAEAFARGRAMGVAGVAALLGIGDPGGTPGRALDAPEPAS